MEAVDRALTSVFANKNVATVLTTFLVLYAGSVAPKLPSRVEELMKNDIARLVIVFLVAYNVSRNTQLALTTAVGMTVVSRVMN